MNESRLDQDVWFAWQRVDALLSAGRAVGSVAVRRPAAGLREVGIRVTRHESFHGTIVEDFLVEKPMHVPALSPNITQGMSRRDEFGVVPVSP